MYSKKFLHYWLYQLNESIQFNNAKIRIIWDNGCCLLMTIITSKYKLLLFFIMPLSPHHNSRGFMWWPYLSVRWSVAQNAGPTNPAGQQCSRKRPQRCWATRTTGVPECFLLPEKLHPTKFMLAAGDYPWHPQTHATLVLFDDWWTKTALL